MPKIFDNIDQNLLPALKTTIDNSYKSDFCVGYFNLRGWKAIDTNIDNFGGGEGKECRLLVGMHRLPYDELKEVYKIANENTDIDNQTAIRIKKQLALNPKVFSID